jgi:nucleobase transporter 1/2
MQGSLILAGGIHMLIGLTGFVGVLLKVVGPLTVVPTLLLLGIELYGVMNTFCDPHWGVSAAYVNKYMYNYDKNKYFSTKQTH